MRVKICGITRPEDARLADRAGADAIGVVLYSDSPRSVSPEKAHEIFRAAGPYTGRVCVSHTSSQQDMEKMIRLHPTAIQISHPHILPEDRSFQVIRVIKPGDRIPADADALIIDASMGKGALFDPKFARNVMKMAPVPVILAGGLTPGNVKEAIRTVSPYAVDVASGVESSPGIKDAEKVRAFAANAKEAYNAA